MAIALALYWELPEDSRWGQLSGSVFTELLGFAIVAVAVTWFIRREQDALRSQVAATRRDIAARQAAKVQDRLTAVIEGSSVFGPHYCSDLNLLKTDLDRFDSDCTELLLAEPDGSLHELALTLLMTGRGLLDSVEALGIDLRGKDQPHRLPRDFLALASASVRHLQEFRAAL